MADITRRNASFLKISSLENSKALYIRLRELDGIQSSEAFLSSFIELVYQGLWKSAYQVLDFGRVPGAATCDFSSGVAESMARNRAQSSGHPGSEGKAVDP